MYRYMIDREIDEELQLIETPPSDCKHPNVALDSTYNYIYCEDCDVILEYYSDPTDELSSNKNIVITSRIDGVKKTLDDLCLDIQPYQSVQIGNYFRQVTEGKVKKGKPRRSILAVCYLVAMPNKLNKLSDLLDAFKITERSFIVGLRTYESKLGPVDLTHMEVPKELLSSK